MADISITLTIPDAKVAAIRDGVLKMRPMPLKEDGTPQYTPKQWFAEILAEYIERLATAGQRQIAEESFKMDVTIQRQ